MAKKLPNSAEADAGLWTRRRILAFAPDDASIPAAEKVLKKIGQRGGLGTVEATSDGKGWWALCPSAQSNPSCQGITIL